MKNYFSKMLVVLTIAILVCISPLFIKDRAALAALMAPLALLCLILYSYYSSNVNQFGNE